MRRRRQQRRPWQRLREPARGGRGGFARQTAFAPAGPSHRTFRACRAALAVAALRCHQNDADIVYIGFATDFLAIQYVTCAIHLQVREASRYRFRDHISLLT
mmetsp:Transcript_2325/g.5794  ORF Transcript_2325/g.5794 Transcript_2325/m.5794 type:complete len:102 (+) Transcript_2325:330-635(+)